MDEEDVAWLDLINERRAKDGLPEVEEAQFELLMDRDDEFKTQSSSSGQKSSLGGISCSLIIP